MNLRWFDYVSVVMPSKCQPESQRNNQRIYTHSLARVKVCLISWVRWLLDDSQFSWNPEGFLNNRNYSSYSFLHASLN